MQRCDVYKLAEQLTEGAVISSGSFLIARERKDGVFEIKVVGINDAVADVSLSMPRAQAKFVIEDSDLVPEDYRINPHLNILARRLNADGTYDPDGERISFQIFESEEIPSLHPDNIKIEGRMKKMFIKE